MKQSNPMHHAFLTSDLVELIEQELRKGPSVGHELLVVADLGDLAVLHHDDLVHLGQEADGVRHQDSGLLFQEACKDINRDLRHKSILSYSP